MCRASLISGLLLIFAPLLQLVAQDGLVEFIPNHGQWDSKVNYRTELPGAKVYFENDGVTFQFYDAGKLSDIYHQFDNLESNSAQRPTAAVDKSLQFHVLKLRFVGSTSQPTFEHGKPKTHHVNYFLGKDESKWASNVEVFQELRYKNLYPGIDLVFYSKGNDLKYDLVVAPKADPAQIKFRYEGADNLKIDAGKLLVQHSLGVLEEQKPVAFQIDRKGKKSKVKCDFDLDAETFGFSVGHDYKPSRELVIDPLLIFSTFSGSAADNWGFTAAFDSKENLYAGGIVFDAGFPTRVGSYQEDFAGGVGTVDIGISKYDSSGSQLLYATYLGGSFVDVPHSLIADKDDNLLILGNTGSPDFPVTAGAIQPSFAGGTVANESGLNYQSGSDLIISKLSADGSALLASTFYGGTGNDGIIAIGDPLIVNYGDHFRGDINSDEDGNVYFVSNTASGDFPTQNSFQSTFSGGQLDAVFAKLSPDLSVSVFSSYWGGSLSDAAYSIKLDSLNRPFIAGGTNSFDMTTTGGSHKTIFGGDRDGYVAHFSEDGSTLLASTFIGTASLDQVYFMDLDGEDNVYLLGQTTGNYPITEGTYNVANSGQFIHSLKPTLDETLFSTTVGSGRGTPDFSPTAFLVNDCENIFISGWGGSINNRTGYLGNSSTNNLPTTPNAFQITTDGTDFYFMVLLKDAEALLYATYFGGVNGAGEHVDGGTSRFSKKGLVYQSVCASCRGNTDTTPPDFPVTAGSWSVTNGSQNCNNAAVKFDLATLKADFVTDEPPSGGNIGFNSGCDPLDVLFINQSIGGINFLWDFGDGTTSTIRDNVLHTFEGPGTYNVSLRAEDINTCQRVDFAYGVVQVFEGSFSSSGDVSICAGASTTLSASGGPGSTYLWEPAVGLSNAGIGNPVASPAETTTYLVTVNDPNGCEYKKEITVEVIAFPQISFEVAYETNCEGIPNVVLDNTSSGASEYEWDFGNGQVSNEEEPGNVQFQDPGTYTISLKGNENACAKTASQVLEIQYVEVPNVITPNDDGKNETFRIIAPRPYELTIFNRWGKEIFYDENYGNTWSASDVSGGMYYYNVKFPLGDNCKGWLEVMKP